MKWVAEDKDVQMVQKHLDTFGIFPRWEDIQNFINEDFAVAYDLMLSQVDPISNVFEEESCVSDFINWLLKDRPMPDICTNGYWYIPESEEEEYKAELWKALSAESLERDIKLDSISFKHAIDNLNNFENQHDDE